MARTEQEAQNRRETGRALHDVAAQARVGRERQSPSGARRVDLGRGQITSRRELGLRGQERLLLGDETPLVRDDAPLRLDAAPRVGRRPHRALRPRDLVVDRPVVDDRETPRHDVIGPGRLRGHGGSVRRVTYSNITGTAQRAVELTLMYGRDPEKNMPNAATPAISDVTVERLAVTTQSGKASYVACHGLPESPIANIRFDRVAVTGGREQSCTYCSIDGPDLSRACRGEASLGVFAPGVLVAVLVAAIAVREVGLLQSARRRRRETRSLAS